MLLSDAGCDRPDKVDTRKYCLVNSCSFSSSWYDGCKVHDSMIHIVIKLEHKNIEIMNVLNVEPETSEDDDNNGDFLIRNIWAWYTHGQIKGKKKNLQQK